MTAFWTDVPRVARRREATDLPRTHPVAFDAPVLIGDCVSPLAGETVLSLLWKRLDAAPDDPEQT